MLSSNRKNEKQTLLHLVHSGMSLRQLSRNERVVLGAICLCNWPCLLLFNMAGYSSVMKSAR